MNDFKKAIQKIYKIAQLRAPLPKTPTIAPKLPARMPGMSSGIPKPTYKPVPKPLPSYSLPEPGIVPSASNPLLKSKPKKQITFDSEGNPIIPKRYYDQQGKIKDPAVLKADLMNAFKQKTLKEAAAINKQVNTAKMISQVQRALTMEKVKSTKTKAAIGVVSGLMTLCYLFSGKKVKTNTESLNYISENLPEPESFEIKKPADMSSKLVSFSNQAEDTEVQAKAKELAGIFRKIESLNLDLSTPENASRYARSITIFDSKINAFLFLLNEKKVETELKADLEKYLLTINSLRGLKNV